MFVGARAGAVLALVLSVSPVRAQPRSDPPVGGDEPLPEGALLMGQLQVSARARQAATEQAAFDESTRLHARLVTLMRRLSVQRESLEAERFEERLSLALKLRSLMRRLTTPGGERPADGAGSPVEPPPPVAPEDVNALTGPNHLAPEPAEWSLPGSNAPRK